MKRSEMKEIIKDILLYDQYQQIPRTKEDLSGLILDTIEKAGMLPPKTHLCTDPNDFHGMWSTWVEDATNGWVYKYEWEPEE